ncbi:hypothetical protein BaRGS_00014599 [Batillaria attramentaria]|uniref:Uncharacterized protein n=1 Tax=Batillaria attramentaria TaxID=370345 RepID=A0ABD0L3M5_9CAEN
MWDMTWLLCNRHSTSRATGDPYRTQVAWACNCYDGPGGVKATAVILSAPLLGHTSVRLTYPASQSTPSSTTPKVHEPKGWNPAVQNQYCSTPPRTADPQQRRRFTHETRGPTPSQTVITCDSVRPSTVIFNKLGQIKSCLLPFRFPVCLFVLKLMTYHKTESVTMSRNAATTTAYASPVTVEVECTLTEAGHTASEHGHGRVTAHQPARRSKGPVRKIKITEPRLPLNPACYSSVHAASLFGKGEDLGGGYMPAVRPRTCGQTSREYITLVARYYHLIVTNTHKEESDPCVRTPITTKRMYHYKLLVECLR